MNRNRMTRASVGLALLAAGAWIVVGSHQATAEPPKAAGTVEAPQFTADPSWPHVPNGWTIGQVSSAASDPEGNIWVMQRPASVQVLKGKKPAPPVLEFDQAGNYIQGWGGPEMAKEQGGVFEWPPKDQNNPAAGCCEHGITVDYKDNVWISGNGTNDQILKFTKDGKFLMQIGHASPKKSNLDTTQLNRPADVFVNPKTNEIFVADGYGNHRIIVFDADTGQFKRMWSAYGNAPVDLPPTPRPTQQEINAAQPTRMLATEFDPKDPGPMQFVSPVHGVKVSNDQLVYVADRGAKRVQVFTTDGKYLTQVWIDRWCLPLGGLYGDQGCNNGNTAASVAFSNDPQQKYLYVASRSPARIWVLERKTLQPLYHFGQPGIEPGEFDVIHHMTTDTKGNLYTSEVEDGRRIQKFVFRGIGKVTLPADGYALDLNRDSSAVTSQLASK